MLAYYHATRVRSAEVVVAIPVKSKTKTQETQTTLSISQQKPLTEAPSSTEPNGHDEQLDVEAFSMIWDCAAQTISEDFLNTFMGSIHSRGAFRVSRGISRARHRGKMSLRVVSRAPFTTLAGVHFSFGQKKFERTKR